MTIDDDIAFLERVPIFALLGPHALRILAIGAEARYVHRGEVLFHAGESADGGYVVQEGSFTLRPDTGEPNPPEITASCGALLGEFALLTETLRPVTATANEPSTVMRIPRSLFLKMLEGYPEAAQRLRDHLVKRAEQTAKDIVAVRSSLDPGSGRS
jgi:CRP-like cAMP-binding protein